LHFVAKDYEGIMNISFCYPVNQKIRPIALKFDFWIFEIPPYFWA